jgi:hypothetical protein
MFGAPWLMSGAASMIGRSGLVNVLPPVANVAISNVQGAPFPMYFAGALVTCYYPVSIASQGMALNVTVQSYNGRMDYGLIACRRAVPDITEIGDYMLAEHQMLMELAKKTAPAPGAAPKVAPAAAPVSAIVEEIKAAAEVPAAKKAPAKKVAARKAAPVKAAAAKKSAGRPVASKKAPAKPAPAQRARKTAAAAR